jgi:hypothetical protein
MSISVYRASVFVPYKGNCPTTGHYTEHLWANCPLLASADWAMGGHLNPGTGVDLLLAGLER